ncbi:MAG: transglutaminase-like domain-containing protein [Erysipelotrichaceae bacterium]|nr:transglutaminase-like domain-containing protein [Erysipelotrichaceae bacterium]
MNENELFLDLNVGLPLDIDQYKKAGDFDKAIKLIDELLTKGVNDTHLRNSLILQKEIMKRTVYDYPHTMDDALRILKDKNDSFTMEDLERYMDEKRFSWVYINKEIRILDRFDGCLLRYEDYRKKINEYKDINIEDTDRYKMISKIKSQGHLEHKIRITHSIKIKDEYFKKGMKVTVHIPIPKVCEHQKDIVIEKCSDNPIISDENHKYRTVCFKKEMNENETFFVTYSYTSYYDYIDLNKYVPEECDIKEYLNEEYPHIVFTDHLRKLTADITKDCDNDLGKAKAIYDYITLNMNYSFQPAYFIRDNIPEYTVNNLRGDCGFFALTFITMCRIAGIPAHFESGLYVGKDDVGAHDWAKFYIKPFGWLYADPSFGVGSRMGNDEESRKYFFGNLDYERMTANSGYYPKFEIEKKYFSNDPFDNQTGEIETDERGLRDTETQHSITGEYYD